MGNGASMPRVDGFSRDEISRIAKRFRKLDLDGSGSISIHEFLSIPGLRENPLAERVADVFDLNRNGEVDLNEFVAGLALFTSQENTRPILEFLFRIYDLDRDGYISRHELFKVLKIMAGKNFTVKQLQQIVDKTVSYLDKDADGKISFNEFCEVISARGDKCELTSKMIFDKKVI